ERPGDGDTLEIRRNVGHAIEWNGRVLGVQRLEHRGGVGRAASRANGTGRRGRLTEAFDAPAWLRCGGRGRGNVKAGIAVGRRLVEHVVARGGIDALGQAERWRVRA